MDSLEYLVEFRQKYGTPSPIQPEVTPATTVEQERAFVIEGKGRTVITAPLREIALVNEGFLYLHGRFVEADRPNENNALWTTEDLEVGQATVAGGPLNWLHDDSKIIGSLMDGRLVTAKESADAGEPNIGTHITSTAAMWGFLFPNEAKTIEKAATDGQLYYSMECLSRAVACVGEQGCGEEFSYMDYDAGRTCSHLKDPRRPTTRRYVDPFFLGGAVIVPPTRPGWANANADVVRAAASQIEKSGIEEAMGSGQARELAAAILTWANR